MHKSEISSLYEAIQNLEKKVSTYRKERNEVFDEREQLQDMVARQDCSIERLKINLTSLENQLDNATTAKCEAMSKCLEIESREHIIDNKGKFMDQERNLLTTQVNNLSENIQKTSVELLSIRQENIISRMQLETELTKKTTDLQFVNSTLNQYIEANKQLTSQAEELNKKLHEMSEESNKMMEHYHKEILNKSKLSELYLANLNDRTAENRELKNANTELSNQLRETIDLYGGLETKLRNIDIVHQKVVVAKNEHIQKLLDELKNANECLKASNEENLHDALERITPTASAISRRLKSNIAPTEIYNLYVKAIKDLQLKENELKQAEVTLKKILTELEQLLPAKKQQGIEFQKISADNEELRDQLEQYVKECVKVHEELIVTKNRFGHFERENKKLKSSQADLGRQVVFLLKEIEQMRMGVTSAQGQSISSDITSTNEVISERLLTFNDIVELQDNNQKLLMLVRDLSSKLEEFEEAHNTTNVAAYEAKIAQYARHVQEIESTSKEQTQMFAACVRDKDRFEHLYNDIIKDVSAGEMQIDANKLDNTEQNSNNQAPNETSNAEAKDKTIADLEKQAEDYVSQLRMLRAEYDEYRRDKLANDKQVNQQHQAMLNQVQELTTSKCKLITSANFFSQKIKTLRTNTKVYKNKIKALEDRNQICDQTISKQEASIMHLHEQLSIVQKKCSSVELTCEDLRRQSQCHKLVAVDVSQLKLEREALNRERLSIIMLQNNLETTKTTIKRTEKDHNLIMEQRYGNVQRECSVLRRRLQDAQDRYCDESADQKRQIESAVKQINDERLYNESLRSQIEQAHHDLATKNLQIDDLSHKLKESSTLCNEIDMANKKIKELQNVIEQRKVEVELLKQDNISRSTKFVKTAADCEADSKKQKQIFEDYRTKMTAKEELEKQFRLQIIGAQLADADTTSQLYNVQTELKEAIAKISENDCELLKLRGECKLLRSSLQTIEQKYSKELMLHSDDIQALAMCKDELNKVKDQIQNLRDERDSNAEFLKSKRGQLEASFGQHEIEKKELETRLHYLIEHGQLQVRSNSLKPIIS